MCLVGFAAAAAALFENGSVWEKNATRQSSNAGETATNVELRPRPTLEAVIISELPWFPMIH